MQHIKYNTGNRKLQHELQYELNGRKKRKLIFTERKYKLIIKNYIF